MQEHINTFNCFYQDHTELLGPQWGDPGHRENYCVNPSFSLTVATKVGKAFLKLVDHHFDKTIPITKSLTKTQYNYRTAAWKTLKQK